MGMYTSGKYTFKAWERQKKAPNGKVFLNTWLGEFNPEMGGNEANCRLDHCGKIGYLGQKDFIRGWEKSRQEYKKGVSK